MIDIGHIGDIVCVKMSGTQFSNKYQCINMLYNMKWVYFNCDVFCQLYYLNHIILYHYQIWFQFCKVAWLRVSYWLKLIKCLAIWIIRIAIMLSSNHILHLLSLQHIQVMIAFVSVIFHLLMGFRCFLCCFLLLFWRVNYEGWYLQQQLYQVHE